MRLKKLILIIIAPILLASCLKSKNDLLENLIDDPGSIIVDIYDVAVAHGTSKIIFMEANPPTETVDFITLRVHAPRAKKPAGDIQATVVLDNSLLPAGMTPLPTNAYTLPSLTVTIPKEGGEVKIPITINKGLLDLTKSYGLGVRLTSVSEGIITATASEFVVSFGVKNRYDGIYSVVSGFVQRYTAPGSPEPAGGLNGSLAGNADVQLVTVGSNTVEIVGLQWAASGGGIGGINNLRLTVDPVTNQVTMFALGNATLTNWAGKENRYDPATKTFYLAFRWNPTSTVREYEVILKYKGPR